MKIRIRFVIACLLLMGIVLVFFGCGGENQEAEFVISNTEFSIVDEGKRVYTVKATGTIRNIGNVDVRDLVISGDCPSCTQAYRQHGWYLTAVEKTEDQKDTIRFLGKGERTNFEFKGLAFFSAPGGASPTEMPDELSVHVLSYEIGR